MTSGSERTERRLVIPEAVQAAIAKVLAVESWMSTGGKSDSLIPPTRDYGLDLAAVAAAEEAIDGRLSDEALAILAAGSEFLARRYGMRLGLVGAHTEDARLAMVPRSLIALGAEGGRFYCVPAKPALGERPRLTICANDGTTTRREPLERWLHERIDEVLEDLELSESQQRHLDSDEVLERFVPRLFASGAVAGPGGALRRVAHPKFGEGTVLRELQGGPETKLEIDFDGGGRRVLLARFVQALEAAS